MDHRTRVAIHVVHVRHVPPSRTPLKDGLQMTAIVQNVPMEDTHGGRAIQCSASVARAILRQSRLRHLPVLQFQLQRHQVRRQHRPQLQECVERGLEFAIRALEVRVNACNAQVIQQSGNVEKKSQFHRRRRRIHQRRHRIHQRRRRIRHRRRLILRRIRQRQLRLHKRQHRRRRQAATANQLQTMRIAHLHQAQASPLGSRRQCMMRCSPICAQQDAAVAVC